MGVRELEKAECGNVCRLYLPSTWDWDWDREWFVVVADASLGGGDERG